MTRDDGLFLEVLKAAIRGGAYDGPLEASNAGALFRAAEIHSVLPLTAEAVYRRPELKDCEEMKAAQRRAVEQVIRQVTQDNEFLNLLEKLQERGDDPLVVKGLICRALYPKPYLRPSVDEDILVPAADFAAYDSLLVELGGMYADFRTTKTGGNAGTVTTTNTTINLAPFGNMSVGVRYYVK